MLARDLGSQRGLSNVPAALALAKTKWSPDELAGWEACISGDRENLCEAAQLSQRSAISGATGGPPERAAGCFVLRHNKMRDDRRACPKCRMTAARTWDDLFRLLASSTLFDGPSRPLFNPAFEKSGPSQLAQSDDH